MPCKTTYMETLQTETSNYVNHNLYLSCHVIQFKYFKNHFNFLQWTRAAVLRNPGMLSQNILHQSIMSRLKNKIREKDKSHSHKNVHPKRRTVQTYQNLPNFIAFKSILFHELKNRSFIERKRRYLLEVTDKSTFTPTKEASFEGKLVNIRYIVLNKDVVPTLLISRNCCKLILFYPIVQNGPLSNQEKLRNY